MNKNDRVIQPIKAHWASHWLMAVVSPSKKKERKKERKPIVALFLSLIINIDKSLTEASCRVVNACNYRPFSSSSSSAASFPLSMCGVSTRGVRGGGGRWGCRDINGNTNDVGG
jgi:hypothetical protein